MKVSSTSRQGRFFSFTHLRSVVPSTNSMATKTLSPKVPTSNTEMTLAWETRAMAWASRSRRAWPRSRPSVLDLPECSSLMATRRLRSGSHAAYTTPMPPSPTRSRMR